MASSTSDRKYLQLALDEAKKALGRTSPNPCVGALIAKEGRIVSTGYHEKAGTPHAEIHALERAGEEAAGATLYVTLEPCNHTGRTPPCSHAVVRSGISRVVIGMLDPNPLVSGAGKRYLIDHGIEVVDGVLEYECRQINEPFIKYITTGLPLVALKAGVSLDGRLNYKRGESGWITGQESSRKVHQLRNEYDAILVGRATVAIDDPSLTTRLQEGGGRDPVRVILDSHLSLPSTAKVLHLESSSSTWIFCNTSVEDHLVRQMETCGARVTTVEKDQHGHLDLRAVLRHLAQEGMTSLLVEGGGKVHSSFLHNMSADKAYLFYAPIFAGSGGESLISNLQIEGREEAVSLTDVQYSEYGDDILVEGRICYPKSWTGSNS